MDLYLTLQQDITRVALQALIAGSTVIPKRTYRITDALGATPEIILVKGETVNTISQYATNETTGEWGIYDISPDTFLPQGVFNVYGESVSQPDPTNVFIYDNSVVMNQVAHGFVVGDWLYMNGGTPTKAIATSEATSNVIGVVSHVIDSSSYRLTSVGYISTLSGLGASGLVFYLSPTTAGAMTTTKPTTVGQVIRKLFVSQTNNAGWVLQEHFEQVERTVRVSGSNVTTTSATESVVTGLTIAVEANALYKGRVTLRIGCSGSGGVRFGFNFPTGATLLVGMIGNSTATTAQQQFSGSLVSGTAATIAFNTLNAQSGFVTIDFTLEVGSTAGNVELIVRSGVAGETSTIYTNMSNMELRRIDI